MRFIIAQTVLAVTLAAVASGLAINSEAAEPAWVWSSASKRGPEENVKPEIAEPAWVWSPKRDAEENAKPEPAWVWSSSAKRETEEQVKPEPAWVWSSASKRVVEEHEEIAA